MLKFNLPEDHTSIIKVIGVGGGGSNAVTHMYKQGIIGVDFAICNTDNQSMELSPVTTKIQLGPDLTEGRGAGSKPNVGREACIESIEDVKKLFGDETKMLFITAGMGGGTGTGAAPVIAKAAQELDILTVGIVTLPFTFEGRRRRSQGQEGLEELKKNVDTLIVISNDKLREIHGNLALSKAFSNADDILATAAKGIAEIITVPGYINVDFEDVNTVMRGSGVAIMGTASAEGDNRARRAVEEALSSPLLEDNDIRGAQHILLNITSGVKEVTMDEIFEITEYVQEEAGQGTDLIWGNCFDESLGDKICVTVIATGFEQGREKIGHAFREAKVRVSLDDDEQKEESSRYAIPPDTEKSIVVEFDDIPKPKVKDDYAKYNAFDEPYVKRGKKMNSTSKNKNKAEEQLPKSEPNVRLNNPQTLNELENQPAYLRRKVRLDDVPHSSESTSSSWSISGDEKGKTNLEQRNSFLHDNVD